MKEVPSVHIRSDGKTYSERNDKRNTGGPVTACVSDCQKTML